MVRPLCRLVLIPISVRAYPEIFLGIFTLRHIFAIINFACGWADCSKHECRGDFKLRRIAYLVSEFPAPNHNYLLEEILGLQRAGATVLVASVSPSSQSGSHQSELEREHAKRLYCIKSTPLFLALACFLAVAFRTPVRFAAGFGYAIQNWGMRGILYFVEALLLGRWMQRNQLSHVHSHFAATVALIASRIFPEISASFTAHGYGEFYSPAGFKLSAKIAGARFVRAISHIGRANLMLSAPETKWDDIVYAPLGVNPDVFRPIESRIPNPALRITCVGRISPEKGQRLLIEAVAALVKENRNVRLRLVGDGPDRQAMETLCENLGISAVVSFDGWKGADELIQVYAETDVFAMASLYEGIPIVLMEAMAMQLPCVAPRVGGIAELIDNGVSGILYNPTVEAELTHALRHLAESPESRERIGKAAREQVLHKYDIRKNAKKFAGILFAMDNAASTPRYSSSLDELNKTHGDRSQSEYTRAA
jgi:glycosyltransferase involved in cell wall biosynthesis